MTLSYKQKASQQKKWACLALVYGALCWGVIWYPYRLLNEAGLPGVQSSVVSYFVALLFGGLLFWRRAARIKKIPFSAYGLSLVAGWTNLAYVLAVIDGEVMRVMLLFYLSPLWTLLLARIWLHESWQLPQLAAIALSLFGAALMLTDGQWVWPLPQSSSDWLALSAGIGFSLTNVITRYSTHLSVAAKGMLVWLGVFGLSVLVLLCLNGIAGLAFVASVTPVMGFWLVLIALLLVSATLLVQYGVTKIPAIQASILFMTELIVAAVAAYFWAHETMSATEMIGGLCIIVAGVLSASTADNEDSASG